MPTLVLSRCSLWLASCARVPVRVAGALVLLAALRSESALDDLKGYWSAWDGRTNDVTGDIAVSPDGITFQNGAMIQLEYAGSRYDLFSSTGYDLRRSLLGRVFRIINPVRSILLNGNTLCGAFTSDVATYLVIYQSATSLNGLKEQRLIVDAYKGSHEPKARSDGQCESMGYVRRD